MEVDRIVNRYSLRIIDKIYEIDRILSNIQREHLIPQDIEIVLKEIRSEISFINNAIISGPYGVAYHFIEFSFIFGKIECTRSIIKPFINKVDFRKFNSSLISIKYSIRTMSSAVIGYV